MGSTKTGIDTRFLSSIHPVDFILRATGVHLIGPQTNSSGKCAAYRQWIWSFFWLLMNTQSGIFILIRRGVLNDLVELFSLAQLLNNVKLTERLITTLMRLTTFICETLTHWILVLTVSSTLSTFLKTLEQVDCELGRPCLSSIRQYSIGSIIFTAWIVF